MRTQVLVFRIFNHAQAETVLKIVDIGHVQLDKMPRVWLVDGVCICADNMEYGCHNIRVYCIQYDIVTKQVAQSQEKTKKLFMCTIHHVDAGLFSN